LLDKDLSCACPFEGVNWDSINKINKRRYHRGWHKVVDILKQDGHFLFGSTKIWQGNNNEKIHATYERLMSVLDSLFEMSFKKKLSK
jgi:hypothetical protein